MTPTPDEAFVAGVIEKLSKAQRAALLWCNADGSPREWLKGAETSFYCLAEIIKGNPKIEAATIYKLVWRSNGTTRRGFGYVSAWALTPLGMHVREQLLRMESGS